MSMYKSMYTDIQIHITYINKIFKSDYYAIDKNRISWR